MLEILTSNVIAILSSSLRLLHEGGILLRSVFYALSPSLSRYLQLQYPFQRPFHVDVRRVKLKVLSIDREDYVEGMVEAIDNTHNRFRSKQEIVLRDAARGEVLAPGINPPYPGFIKASMLGF